MNPAILKQRSAIIKLIRRFFDERGYFEMHTPRLVGLPGQEPYLEPFWTEIASPVGADRVRPERYAAALITSPEYAMKRLLAAGFDKIYDLGPCFRNNEPWDGTHDPEFLMLEWYRRRSPEAAAKGEKNGDLASLMDETEEMIKWVAKIANYELRIANFRQPFRRLTCEQAWKEFAGVDLASLIGDREAMAKIAREHGQTVAGGDAWDDLYFKVFLTEIEPKVAETPTFLHRYPASQAALALALQMTRGLPSVSSCMPEDLIANSCRTRRRGWLRRASLKNGIVFIGKGRGRLIKFCRPPEWEAIGTAFSVDQFVMRPARDP